MTPPAPDMLQHVARSVRITRMFHNFSLEDASRILGIPVWLLYYKENSLLHFSYQDLLSMEALYKLPWISFFRDFFKTEHFGKSLLRFTDADALFSESDEKLDAVMNYLAHGAVENHQAGDREGHLGFGMAESPSNSRETLSIAGRWA